MPFCHYYSLHWISPLFILNLYSSLDFLIVIDGCWHVLFLYFSVFYLRAAVTRQSKIPLGLIMFFESWTFFITRIYIIFTDMFSTFWNSHVLFFLAALCTLNLSRHLMDSDDVELLPGSWKAYVTHVLICYYFFFHR